MIEEDAAAGLSRMLVPVHQITQRQIPTECNQHPENISVNATYSFVADGDSL
jgi:hypothetical protein